MTELLPRALNEGQVFLFLIFAGLGIAFSAVIWQAVSFLQKKTDPVRKVYTDAVADIKNRTRKTFATLKVEKKDQYENLPVIGAACGAAGGILLAWGTPRLALAAVILAAVGFGAGKLLQKSFRDRERFQKMRELAVLAETVEFLSEVKYTIPQAFHFAAALMPKLKPLIERCIARWPSGPERALYMFAEEVGLYEAAVLTSVLTHAQESGMEYVQRVLQEESRNLESLRRTLAEIKIVSKPVYFAIYRGLPLLAIASILVGPLMYRVLNLLKSVFGGW